MAIEDPEKKDTDEIPFADLIQEGQDLRREFDRRTLPMRRITAEDWERVSKRLAGGGPMTLIFKVNPDFLARLDKEWARNLAGGIPHGGTQLVVRYKTEGFSGEWEVLGNGSRHLASELIKEMADIGIPLVWKGTPLPHGFLEMGFYDEAVFVNGREYEEVATEMALLGHGEIVRLETH